VLSHDELDQVRAMRERGWSISVIARHLGRDRKTVRAYLTGDRQPGRRRDQQPDPLQPFIEYCRTRLTDDPHLAATTLFSEAAALGYPGAYQTFTRSLRAHDLRPECPECAAAAAKPPTPEASA
jgi:transposase